jgi:hypothetical protein
MFRKMKKTMAFRLFYFILIVPLLCSAVWMALPGMAFSVCGAPATIQTNPATNITPSSATLNGYITTVCIGANVYFKWGTTQGGPYPYTTSAQPMLSSGSFSATIQSLAACATYYYVAAGSYVANNGIFDNFRVMAMPDILQGAEQSFLTYCGSSDNNKKSFIDDVSPSAAGGGTIGGMSWSNLSTSHNTYASGQPVTVYARVMNTTDIPGGYTATLKINGIIEQTKFGTLKPQVAEPVEFTVYKNNPGTYQVEVNGLKTSFTVNDAVQKSNTGTNSQTTVLIIISLAAVVLLLLVAVLWWRRQS